MRVARKHSRGTGFPETPISSHGVSIATDFQLSPTLKWRLPLLLAAPAKGKENLMSPLSSWRPGGVVFYGTWGWIPKRTGFVTRRDLELGLLGPLRGKRHAGIQPSMRIFSLLLALFPAYFREVYTFKFCVTTGRSCFLSSVDLICADLICSICSCQQTFNRVGVCVCVFADVGSRSFIWHES